ncbi:rhomboid family intramembrane serine protease [Tundrisphaera lichenicola]|uniref:rhomboid family intramembrane serine protease n=1 Tax=Tundrisphaera lichenicola TaxID=2029860 RepID=UPI003EBEB857
MGIYDREYYRDKTRGSGWLSGVAPACKTIILINVAVFIAQKFFGPDQPLERYFSANSFEIFRQFRIWELLTATFLHDGPWHILMNMLFLWMVGREMESFYGTRDFVALYISAAILSTLTWAIADALGPFPGRGYMMGASGAVMAVIVLYTLYYPRREVLLFIFPVEMWMLLVIFLGMDLLQFLSGSGGPVAYASHLGGAGFGYLFKVGDLRLSRLEKMFKRRPRLRIVSPEPRETTSARPTIGATWSSSTAATTRPAPTAVIPEEQFDEKLDEILVKIARDGKGALNEEENRILDEASRRARNRRSERI